MPIDSGSVPDQKRATVTPAEDALCILIRANRSVQNHILKQLNDLVLSDPYFSISPGGSTHHHAYIGGLVIHVAEVMKNVLQMTGNAPSDELITAVIWHDYMKTKDYGLDGETLKNMPYRKLICHLAGSAMEFHHKARERYLITSTLEHIEHLLLSHHGRKEWGSPVEPATAEAFILHAADMMSATGCNL